VREALSGTGTLDVLEQRISEIRSEAEAVLERAGLPEPAIDALRAIDAYNAGRSV
jgi:hypothetical protein